MCDINEAIVPCSRLTNVQRGLFENMWEHVYAEHTSDVDTRITKIPQTTGVAAFIVIKLWKWTHPGFIWFDFYVSPFDIFTSSAFCFAFILLKFLKKIKLNIQNTFFSAVFNRTASVSCKKKSLRTVRSLPFNILRAFWGTKKISPHTRPGNAFCF